MKSISLIPLFSLFIINATEAQFFKKLEETIEITA